METLAADMICGSLPVLAAFVPKFLACWGARFPAEAEQEGALRRNVPGFSLVCLGFCRPSSGVCWCVCPPRACGVVGHLPIFYTFSRVLGQERCNNLCSSLCPAKSAGTGRARKGSREPQNAETCQLGSSSSPVAPPSPEAEFFPLLLHSSPRCSFMLWCRSGRPSSP